MSSLACFDSLIGLSKVAYSCFTDTEPVDFDESDSGYHLTDTDFGLTVIEQCALEGWTLLQAAKEQAVMELKTDLRAALRERYDGGISPFSGLIGQITSTGTVSVSKDFLGLRIRTRNQKGAKLVLKKLYLGLNLSGTYSISITSNDPLFVSPSPVSVVYVAGSFQAATLTPVIELPLFSRSCNDQYLEYYLSFERNGASPLNNKITCCGAKPGWMNHVTVSGFAASDDIASDGNISGIGHGLAIDGYMACEELDWLCEAEELGGYHIKDVLARCVQQRGAAIAISALIDTLQVNPCTGYQLENLNSKRSYLNKRYSENVTWISQNMPSGVTNCFTCKPERMFHRSHQIV
jgi:hypothetical protein